MWYFNLSSPSHCSLCSLGCAGAPPTDFYMRWASCIYGCSVAPLSVCEDQGQWCIYKRTVSACMCSYRPSNPHAISKVGLSLSLSGPPQQQLPRLSHRHYSLTCMQMRSDWVAFCAALCVSVVRVCVYNRMALCCCLRVYTCAFISGGRNTSTYEERRWLRGSWGYKVDRCKIWHRS